MIWYRFQYFTFIGVIPLIEFIEETLHLYTSLTLIIVVEKLFGMISEKHPIEILEEVMRKRYWVLRKLNRGSKKIRVK